MRRITWVMFLLTLLAAPAFAQAPVAQPGMGFGFDYRAEDITNFSVVRFELQVDATPFVSVNMPPIVTRPDTLTGHQTRRIEIPALAQGNHTYTVRACNATVCGSAMTPVPFQMLIVPPQTGNGRLLPPPPPSDDEDE